MDKPVYTKIDEDDCNVSFGSLGDFKGKKLNTDTSKITDAELFKLALMAVIVKEADSE